MPTKRTVLGLLMLVVGGVTSMSVEGLVIGLPLLAIGTYWLLKPRFAARHRGRNSVTTTQTALTDY